MTHTLIDIDTLKVLVRYAENWSTLCNRQVEFLTGALATAEELIESPIHPQIVANISGGILQGASASYPVELYTLDFEDVDECNPHIIVEGSAAYCSGLYPVIDPEFVAALSTRGDVGL